VLRDSPDAKYAASVPRVHFVDFPLREGMLARQHLEALFREFAIIAAGGGDPADVPKRLLEIAELHQERYAGMNPEADAAVDDAMDRGDRYIDFDVTVPDQIRDDTLSLAPVLLEVDAYCRNGDMLTLSPNNEIRSFWFWFLREIVRQVNGEAPMSWHQFELPDEMQAPAE
jgi:hypothetical protein